MAKEDWTLTPCTDTALWDRLLGQSRHGSAFLRSDFLSAMPVLPELWLLGDGERFFAGAPVFRSGDIFHRAPMPLTIYQGPFLVDCDAPSHKRVDWELEVAEVLIDRLSAQCDRLSWSLSPHYTDIRTLQWFNYHTPEAGQFSVTVRYSGIIDLSAYPDFPAYLATLMKGRRSDWKKANVSGLDVALSQDVESFDRLHGETFLRQGLERAPAEVAMIASVLPPLLASGACEMLLARAPDGTAVAANIFLYDDKTAYYYFGATNPDWRQCGISTRLFLDNLRRAWERGITKIDMVGLNSPSRGFFKASFNAEPVPYFDVDWTRPAGASLASS